MIINFCKLACLFTLLLTSACTVTQEQVSYDQNSWKTMIPDSCLSFFDGCNNCRRSAGSEVAACTRMYCATYSKPVCLDDKKQ